MTKYKSRKLVIISSPTGGGKNTIVNMLLKADQRLEETISCATRQPRENEINGREYYFVNMEEFRGKIENGEFMEWMRVHDFYYGTLKSEVNRIFRKGNIPILVIEVRGAMNIKKLFPEALLIFIKPNSVANMKERIMRRAFISDQEIKTRLSTAREELKMTKYYDYIITNHEGHPEKAVEDIRGILGEYLPPQYN